MPDQIEIGEHDRRWLVGKHVDILLNAEPVRYEHDGLGGVQLCGGQLVRPVKFSIEAAMARLEPLEERRAQQVAGAFVAPEAEWFDAVVTSLLTAIDAAEHHQGEENDHG